MKKNLKIGIFASLVVASLAGVVASPIISHNLEVNSSIKQIRTNLSNNKHDLQTYQQNLLLLKKLNAKKIDSKILRQLSDKVITTEQVEQFKNDILNKIAASIWTLANKEQWSYETAKNAVLEKCGIFLKNFQMQKEGLNPDELDENQSNASLYQYLQDQEDAMNIDVFDSYEGQLVVESMKEEFNQSLFKMSNDLVSLEKKNSLSVEFSSIFDGYVDIAKSFYYSQLQFDIGLLDLEKSINFFEEFVKPLNRDKNDCTYQNYTASIADKQLELVFNNFVEYYRDSLQIYDDGREFIDCIADYSSNGYLSLENNLINTEDLSKLFTYKYNTLQGSILLRPTFNYSIMAGHGDELKDDYGIGQVLPIQDFKSLGGAEYAIGELYPGYLAHFRIHSLVDNKDDSQCNISLEIGVSDAVRDPQSEHILWLSDYNKQQSVNDDSIDDYQLFNLVVDGLTEKSYIANHKFYTNLTTELSFDDYDKETDEYYSSSAASRSYLNDILDTKTTINEDGSYNVSKEAPLYLSDDDIAGIPVPELPTSFVKSNSSNYDSYTSSVAYEHQYLKFMVTDYNTNTSGEHKLSLYGHWVIMSNSPSNISDNKNDKTTLEKATVYDIPWNNVNTKDIWVSYQIDESLFKIMSDTLDYASVVKEYVENIEPNVLALDEKDAYINGKTAMKAAEEQLIINITTSALDVSLIPLLSASCAFCVGMSVVFWQKITAYIAYGIAIAAQVLSCAIDVIWISFFAPAYFKTKNNILPTVKEISSDVHKYSDDIVANCEKLNSPRLNFAAKKDAVASIYNDVGLSSDGSEVIDQEKLDNANSWFDKIKSLVNDDIDDELRVFFKNKFVFNKDSNQDFEMAHIAYYSIIGAAIGGLVSTISGFIQSFISVWNTAIQVANVVYPVFSTAAGSGGAIIRVVVNFKNIFGSIIQKVVNNIPSTLNLAASYSAQAAEIADAATMPSPTLPFVVICVTTLVEMVNATLSFVKMFAY